MLFTTLPDGYICIVTDNFSEGCMIKNINSFSLESFCKGIVPWNLYLEKQNVNLNNLYYFKDIEHIKEKYPELSI